MAGGLFPQPCQRIIAAIRRGDEAEARALDAHLRPLCDLFAEFSSLRVAIATANLLGICRTAAPLPIQPLPPAAQRRIAEVLKRLALD